jgi:hypothetical protein
MPRWSLGYIKACPHQAQRYYVVGFGCGYGTKTADNSLISRVGGNEKMRFEVEKDERNVYNTRLIQIHGEQQRADWSILYGNAILYYCPS